jgi:hypothetical protein
MRQPPAVVFPLLLCPLLLTAGAHGQSAFLPEAPSAAAQQTVRAAGTASVAGVVVDRTGAAIPNATVTLTRLDGTRTRAAADGPHGEFSFDALRAGDFELSVKAAGFDTYTSAIFTLADGQNYTLPNVQLVVGMDTEVDVASNAAEIQMKQEEKQRVLGIIPNYYVVYSRDPVPLNTSQKYRLALRDTFDPVGFVGAAISAGFEQEANTFPGYGNDAASYGKRYAAIYGDGLTSDLLSHAVFPSIFHQDPRYFYQGTGTRKSRFVHAVSFAVITHNDHGGDMPNYSYLLGDLGSGALSNLYYPHANRGAGLVFANAGLGLLGQAGGSLVEEFLLPYFTTHSGKFGRPKKQPAD